VYVIPAVISFPSLAHRRCWAAQSNKIANNQHLPLRNDDQKSSTLTATSLDADQTQLRQRADGP